ncbi:hypothetical protein ABT052_41675 [Streptomyces sp. NPDC002766]|uniref:hypothetical protein n=1 Tax=Streptomyces sp. NPDC002766 TaxID=3154429 RepID=UPI003333F607
MTSPSPADPNRTPAATIPEPVVGRVLRLLQDDPRPLDRGLTGRRGRGVPRGAQAGAVELAAVLREARDPSGQVPREERVDGLGRREPPGEQLGEHTVYGAGHVRPPGVSARSWASP